MQGRRVILNRFVYRGVAFICFILAAACARADIKLPGIFSDNMVLQSAKGTSIWGRAAAQERVTIRFADVAAETTADAGGSWRIDLDLSHAPTTAFDVTVSGNQSPSSLVIKNVAVGEVWLASGQSNMEKPVGPQPQQHPVDNWEKEVADSGNPMIRVFTVAKAAADKPADDCKGKWELASPATTARFTAAGYFFAREINKELHVPVGIINSSWGGTRVEAWTSLAGTAHDPELAALADEDLKALHDAPQALKQYHDDVARWASDHHCSDPGDAGEKAGYADPAASLADWSPVKLGSSKKGSITPGVRWYRTTVAIPPEAQGKVAVLDLGAVNGFDTAYLNNTRVGGTSIEQAERATSLRQYFIPPAQIKTGTATIAMRVVNYVPEDAVVSQAYRMAFIAAGKNLKMEPWLVKAESTFPPLDEAAYQTYPQAPSPVLNFDTAAMLFNGMINPLIPYGIAGVLWYQGESNSETPAWEAPKHPKSPYYQGEHADPSTLYRKTFPALIADWRTQWQRREGRGDFPFYYCQLANFGMRTDKVADSTWAEIREAQRLTLQKVDNTGMAVLIDNGEAKDIHPTNKQEAGHRLALIALAQAYGRKIEFSGPLYQSMTMEGAKVRLRFTHIAAGLVARALPDRYPLQSYAPANTVPWVMPRPGSPLQGFAISGADGKLRWADATIDGGTVIVSHPDVPKPTAVRYGWANDPTCNLYNAAGLPASPFRTDDHSR